MNKLSVALLFGGISSEHEISRISACAILENLSPRKYNIFTIGITKSGTWYLYKGTIDEILNGEWEKNPENQKVSVLLDSKDPAFVVLDGEEIKKISVDVVIPALHGQNGEDGKIQGLFSSSGIACAGCDAGSCVICMDKTATATLLTSKGVKKPKFFWFFYDEFKENENEIIAQIESSLENYPLFIKPSSSGSSVGISKAKNRNDLIFAIETAKNEDKKIIVEQAIEGKEIECAVLGNDEIIVSEPGEIVPGAEFYTYDAKYIDSSSELFIPARISSSLSEKIKIIARKAYKITGCQGLARVDFLVDSKTSEIFLNEINTFPGFTPISMYPKLMQHYGIDFPSLIDKIIKLALEKQKKLRKKDLCLCKNNI